LGQSRPGLIKKMKDTKIYRVTWIYLSKLYKFFYLFIFKYICKKKFLYIDSKESKKRYSYAQIIVKIFKLKTQ